ncbi:acyl-CoA dehydrogenase [Sporosarcina sp. P3]|uniref:acyl-CoA dehydrogenase family protein n=1 Tax=Sporosarcina sp. P3 TaxID=2048245 RepID=UPI000C1697C8|nr:acyl-CoA dehydrogenase family protein [Sporosarcina sp. P3]PID20366.1 acyl-CoA dehydrogenase [Sporosarcina sp. P3]
MEATFITEEHEMFRESLKRMLDKEAYPYYDKWEKEKKIPREFWLKLGESGFLLPWADEKYGGLELDFSYSAILTEELEKVGVGLASGVCLHSDIVSPYIHSHGTEEQKQKWLPKSVTGEFISAVAMTEPGAGSDLAGIRTTARKEGDFYILNGEKTFITNGLNADYVIVVCKTDTKAEPAYRGISLLVVEKGTQGFKRGKSLDKIGMHSSDTCELIFEDAKVPIENLLGEEGKGFYYLMEQLQQERLVVALQVQVEAEEMLEITIDYVKERKAFGSRIADFQNTQFKLAEMATEIDLGRTYINSLISKHIRGDDIVKEVSMAKWWISEMAKRVASECLQLHGGYGYIEEYEIARRYRDIAVTSIYAGTTEIMKGIIAKKILTEE